MKTFNIEESIGSLSLLYHSYYSLKKEKDCKETIKTIEKIEDDVIAQFKKLNKQLRQAKAFSPVHF